MATTIRGDDNFDTSYIKAIAILADVKGVAAEGGSAVQGWQTRELNTEMSDVQNIVTLASNQFTLQAGQYLIEWNAPFYNNITNSADESIGGSDYTAGSSNATTRTGGSAVVTISGATTYSIMMNCQSAAATHGLGLGTLTGSSNSVYTRVLIHKIGA